MEANQEVKTVTKKPKNPGRVEAGKKMAELNKAKRLMKNNDKPTKQESQPQYWIYGLLLVAGVGLVYYKVSKPVTKEQPIVSEPPKETVKTSDKPDPFAMK